MSTQYETDFYAWTREQADLARRCCVNALDLANIAEELESMGRAERRALASQLERLMAHLLKHQMAVDDNSELAAGLSRESEGWRYQPQHRGRSWRRSIRDSRRQIARLLADSPSLGGELPALIEAEWLPAVRWASDETKISRRAFPAACPWSEAELLDPAFLP